MKIRITRTTILHDGMTAVSGQVFEDFPDADARALIARQVAENWEPLENRLPISGVIETREPETETRDPIPQARKEPKRTRRKHA